MVTVSRPSPTSCRKLACPSLIVPARATARITKSCVHCATSRVTRPSHASCSVSVPWNFNVAASSSEAVTASPSSASTSGGLPWWLRSSRQAPSSRIQKPRTGCRSSMKRRSSPSARVATSATELLFEQLVQACRVGLALRGLHRLADEESEQLVLARAILGQLRWIGGDDGVNSGLDRRLIGNLAPAARLDDCVGILAFVPHRLQHVLGNLARDGVVGNSRQQLRQRRRGDAAVADLHAVAVEQAGELADDGIGR